MLEGGINGGSVLEGGINGGSVLEGGINGGSVLEGEAVSQKDSKLKIMNSQNLHTV